MDLTTYITSDGTNYVLDSTRQAEVMNRLRSVVANFDPALATSPASITGRLGVVPLSQAVGMLEQALECVLSDLNLQNAMDGIVCDCDFVEAVLKSLGITTLAEANVTGMVRIYVNENKSYTFRSSMSMLFKDQYMFNIYSAGMPEITVLPFGSTTPEGTVINDVKTLQNTYILSASGFDSGSNLINEWFIDLPVYGPASADILAGETAAIDSSLPYFDNITSISLVSNITPYITPTTLAELLTTIRAIQPCASLTTRSGAVSYVINKFPQAVGCSPVLNGDSEISKRKVGDPNSTYDAPKMDLYVKGKVATCTEILPLKEDWIVQPQHSPIKILSASYATDNTEIPPDVVRTCIQSNLDALYDAYTPWEKLLCKRLPETTNEHAVSLMTPSYISSTFDRDVMVITRGGVSIGISITAFSVRIASNVFYSTINIGITADDSTITVKATSQEVEETFTFSKKDKLQDDNNRFICTSVNQAFPYNRIIFTLTDTTTNTWEGTKAVLGTWLDNSSDSQEYSVTVVSENTPINITYEFDPIVRAVNNSINNDANYPIVSTMVKQTIPVIITSLVVEYFKMSSKYVDHQAVTSAIVEFLNTCMYPVNYSDAYITDILIKNGASGINKISASARIQRTVGSTFVLNGSSDVVQTSDIVIEDLANISSVNDPATSQPFGSRNISFYITPEAINLKEVIVR